MPFSSHHIFFVFTTLNTPSKCVSFFQAKNALKLLAAGTLSHTPLREIMTFSPLHLAGWSFALYCRVQGDASERKNDVVTVLLHWWKVWMHD